MTSQDFLSNAHIIAQALPYMQRYDKKRVVVKYGGHAMGDAELGRAFARDITLLRQSGVHPVVVHGGGPQIGSMLTRLGIVSEFKGGLRVTDKATVEIVEMVLAGSINKEIVQSINAEGGRAVGLCGKDGNLVKARKLTRTMVDPNSHIEQIVDLGFVGEPAVVNPTMLELMLKEDLIPVVAPVAPGEDGATYNINADTFAGAIAGALNASRLLFLTDVPGVLDKDGKLIKQLTVARAHELIADGTISGGMIPKIAGALDAARSGVNAVHIIDGRVPHALLLEVLGNEPFGTMIKR